MDQSGLNRFLTLYSWDEEEVYRMRLELLQFMEGMGWRRDGVIAVDDTLLSKAGKRMPGAGKLFDHSSGRFVHAQCLVTSHYIDREKDYLEFREYFKDGSGEATAHGFKTKIELAMELVDECERLGVAAENYAFDVWYLSKELSRHIQSHGKGWVRRLKSNRIIHAEGKRMGIREWGKTVPRDAFKEVEVIGKKYWAYTKVLKVKKLEKVRVVVCYENKNLEGDPAYLATSRFYWEERRTILCYTLRFRIETSYKDAKQNLGLGCCHLRSLKGTKRHWQLGFLGYSLLSARVCRSRLYRRLESDQTIGAECRQAIKDLIQNLIQWIYKMAPKMPVEKMLEVILR